MIDPKRGNLIRLHKFLADAGVASRRASEELILEGRVGVNGLIVQTLGTKIDPEKDKVTVDSESILLKKSKTYIAFHKPIGVLSTMSEPEGRSSLGDYFADREERLFHVGRLDKESEGLILLTNDGDVTHRATHPSYGLTKKYLVEVEGTFQPEYLSRLLSGIELDDGLARAQTAVLLRQTPTTAWIELTMHEGRYHIVRRMMEALGLPVVRLIRTEFGPIHLGETKVGRFRYLNETEVENLFNAIKLKR